MCQRLFPLFLFAVCQIFGGESVNESNYFDPSVAYGDSSGVVAGHVNVITGDFIDYGCDLIVPGPNPLVLERNYASGVFKQSGSNLHSWHLNYESDAFVSEGKRSCMVELCSPHGAQNHFGEAIPKDKTTFSSAVAARNYAKGFTNTSSGVVSGQTHLKNTSFQYTKKSDHLYVTNGEGAKYTYARQEKQNQNIHALFRLHELKYPNGNKVLYRDYKTYKTKLNRWKLPTLIKSVNADETETFGEIRCQYQNQKEKKLYCRYKTDKGRWVTYTFLVHKGIEREVPTGFGKFTMQETSCDKQCLVQVSGSHRPTVSYKWEDAGKDPNGYKKERIRIKAKTEPNPRRTEVLYDKENRVKELKAPVGQDHHPVTTHRFQYKRNDKKIPVETKVFDAENHLTTYHFSDDYRISSICRYLNDKLYTKECFVWGKKGSTDCGNLLRHWLEPADSSTLKSQSYRYDSNGNVIEERAEGNLTGQGKRSEAWSVYRTYSQDGKNLLISETAGDKTTEFTYYPDNYLVQSKRIRVSGAVLLREFFFYDSNAVLIQSISDDGTGKNAEDLNGVTQRTITRITPTTAPVMGLPGIVEESYLDISTGKEVFLGKTINSYSVDGKLVRQEKINADGKSAATTAWEYDPHGNLLQETDALGQTTVRFYDENDNLVEEHGPRCKKTFVYDYANRLIAEYLYTGKKELIKRYGYNHLNQKIWEEDIHGNRTHFTYDALGRMTEILHPDGSVRSMEYDLLDNLTAIKDENGHTTKKNYNSRNQLTKEVLPDGSTTHYVYDLKGRLVKQVAANGTTTHKRYDPFDRLIEEEHLPKEGVLLSTRTWKYSALHLLEETDPNGVTTYYEYDGAGRLISETKGDVKTCYAYDALGRQTKKIACIDPHTFRVAHFSYDPLDRQIEERIENQNATLFSKVAYQYDADGNRTHVIKEGQAGVAIHQTEYDALGREVCATDPLGNVTFTLYHDAHPFTKEMINPNGVRTLEIHDARGNVATLLRQDLFEAVIQKTEYEHDPAGNIVRQTEHVITPGKQNRKITLYREYDPCNRETVSIEAFGTFEQKETRTTYIASGLKSSLTKPDGVVIHYCYDGLGRQIRRYASDGTLDEHYHYDRNGNLLSSEERITGITTKRKYDANNRMVIEILGNSLEMKYRYDPLDRIAEVILPDASKICYRYDAGYLRRVERRSPKGALLYTHAYNAYDLSSRLCRETLVGNAGTLLHQYDLCSRPIAQYAKNWSDTVPSDGYDPAGNLIKRQLHDSQGEAAYTYCYDPLDQLVEEGGFYPHRYTCDSLSNRVQKDAAAYTVTPLNQVSEQSHTHYSYDPNGNRASKQSPQEAAHYRYDALNRLIQVEKERETVAYSYDTFNRRLTRTSGDRQVHYIYFENEEVGACDSEGILIELKVLGHHRAVAMEIDSQAYAVITDQFGNTAQLINPCTGDPVADYRYSAFAQESSSLLIPWRYHQKREDPFTQLIHFGYRDYDSEIGGWSTPDPLGFADGPNLYAYVHHNPIVFHDPDGTTAYPHHESYRPQRYERNHNYTQQFWRSFTRGFIDDTTWGTSDYVLGEHASTNWTQKVGYGTGVASSMATGLFYGATEAKAIATGLKGIKFAGKQLYKCGNKLCTRNFKRVTVMNSADNVAKATKHAEKYFVRNEATCNLLNVDKLSKAGRVMDRNGLTRAGRALDKHGNRVGSPFPKAMGNPKTKNAQGQFHLDDILTDPRGRTVFNKEGGIEIYSFDGKGAYFKSNGCFRGFLKDRSY